jgi:hypothetical protein
MNRHDLPAESAGSESAEDHSAEYPWCAEEMPGDREMVELIQRALWDSLAHQTPPPEVWDRIQARLPERKRAGRGEHTGWTWPLLVSNAVAVGLLIAFMGLIVWQPLRPSERDVASPPAAPRTDSQVGQWGIDEQGPALSQEDEKPTVIAALPGGTSKFDVMTSEGLLNVGYLNYLQRHPRPAWKGPRGLKSAATDTNDPRSPLP